MNVDLFRQHFNQQAKLMNDALHKATCCGYGAYDDKLIDATNRMEDMTPENESGFSDAQIQSIADQIETRGYRKFIAPFLKIANRNAYQFAAANIPVLEN